MLVFGPTLFWWIPCFFLALGNHVWLGLLWPFLGFCPWPAGSGDPGYSETATIIFGAIMLFGFIALAFYALRKNSQAIATACAICISLSSLLVIGRMIVFVILEQR